MNSRRRWKRVAEMGDAMVQEKQHKASRWQWKLREIMEKYWSDGGHAFSEWTVSVLSARCFGIEP
jgi:hypothetical protein